MGDGFDFRCTALLAILSQIINDLNKPRGVREFHGNENVESSCRRGTQPVSLCPDLIVHIGGDDNPNPRVWGIGWERAVVRSEGTTGIEQRAFLTILSSSNSPCSIATPTVESTAQGNYRVGG